MLLVARRAPIQSRPEGEVETEPQIARVSVLSGKVMCTPHPAEPFGRAEPSVKINAEGLSSKGSPGPVDLDMYSSAFFRVVNRFTSAGIPTV